MFTLASGSPRRAQLLQQAGFEFTVNAVDIDESPYSNESPDAYVQRMAIEKAKVGLSQEPINGVVLAADTIGEINGEILLKPKSRRDFKRVFRLLSGQTHSVSTAVCVCTAERIQHSSVKSYITFDSLSGEQIDWYWQTGEPTDKAGGYAIQGIAAQFVRRIEGSYSAVVGLPLCETRHLLAGVGIHPKGLSISMTGQISST